MPMATTTKKATEVAGVVVAFAATASVAVIRFVIHRRKPHVSSADTPADERLRLHAKNLGADSEYQEWAESTRLAAKQGLSPNEKIGKDELLRRKAEVRRS